MNSRILSLLTPVSRALPRSFLRPRAAVFLALISTFNASAQDDDFDALELLYGDEETVSIATGSSKAIHLAPSVATVITAQDIEAMGANNLDDVLESVPGLHVYLLKRFSSGYSIRGIHTEFNPQVLVLLNGYPLSESFSGSRAPKLYLPVHSISRIEVIRGPGSAVYGADAFAGVINIITKTADEVNSTSIGASIGSFDTRSLWLQTGTEFNGWDTSFSFEWEKSNGDDSRNVPNDLQTAFDNFFATTASLAPGNSLNHYDVFNSQLQLVKGKWNFTYNYWRQKDAGIGVGIADALDTTGNQDSSHRLFEVDYTDEQFAKDWEFNVKLNYFYLKQRSYYTIFPPGVVLPIGSDGNLDFTSTNFVSFPDGYIGSPGGTDKSLSSELTFFYTGIEKHRTRFSAGYKTTGFESVETKNFGPGVIDGSQPIVDGALTDVSDSQFVFLPDRDRDVYFFSVQDEWALYTDWELTVGIRYDDYSDFGDTVNPRLALVWQTNYNLTSKLLYGQAFRAPSFSELFSINNPVVLGNPDLDPEKIDTLELSFDYRPNYDLTFKLNLFSYQIDGLIDFVPDTGAATSTAQNALDQEGQGFELEFDWSINENLSLIGSYSRQDSENSDTGAKVADAPRTLASLDLRWELSPTWHLSAQAHHVGDRPRAPGDARAPVDDYNLVNLSLYTKQFTPNWDMKLSAYNIFDEEAYEPGNATVPIDHMLQHRSVLFDLYYRFGN